MKPDFSLADRAVAQVEGWILGVRLIQAGQESGGSAEENDEPKSQCA
jgi:hypothetical protein